VKPKVRLVPITQLVLDEKNANKGTKRGRELLGDSLEKYGAGRSVVVDRYNRVIAGNKTVEAAVAAGMKSIAVIETDGLSLVAVQRGDLDLKKDKMARELAIADNRVVVTFVVNQYTQSCGPSGGHASWDQPSQQYGLTSGVLHPEISSWLRH
jgi:hypothetical protein